MTDVFSSIDEFLKILNNTRQDKKIVFTNGCFDIMHAGHINILKSSAELGDILVVGLNTDASVKRLKGDNRPINNQDDRAIVLASLKFVDHVILFDEDTPYEVISMIKPDILAKGGEYGEGEVVGEDIVTETVRIPMKPGYSTTDIIRKIKEIT